MPACLPRRLTDGHLLPRVPGASPEDLPVRAFCLRAGRGPSGTGTCLLGLQSGRVRRGRGSGSGTGAPTCWVSRSLRQVFYFLCYLTTIHGRCTQVISKWPPFFRSREINQKTQNLQRLGVIRSPPASFPSQQRVRESTLFHEGVSQRWGGGAPASSHRPSPPTGTLARLETRSDFLWLGGRRPFSAGEAAPQ